MKISNEEVSIYSYFVTLKFIIILTPENIFFLVTCQVFGSSQGEIWGIKGSLLASGKEANNRKKARRTVKLKPVKNNKQSNKPSVKLT